MLLVFVAFVAIAAVSTTLSATTEGEELHAGSINLTGTSDHAGWLIDASMLDLEPLFLPLILNRHDHTLNPPVFGVQMYFNTGPTGPMNQFHPYLIDSRASWLRVSVSWRSVEEESTELSSYDWSSADQAVSAAWPESGGLTLIATIENNPEWVTPHLNGPIPPDHLDSFAAFVQAAVERYDGDGLQDAPGSPVIRHWEFYNEPDNFLVPRWGDAGDEYANMLFTIYSPVKTANPNAQVLLGGLAYDWFEENGGPFNREFLDDVLSAHDGHGGDYFDIMNFHYYPLYWNNWTDRESPGLLEKANFLKQKLVDYGYPDKPMFVTEAGWHSNVPDNPLAPASSPEEQARYVVELFTQNMAAGSDVMIWWMLHDPGGFYPFDTGLVTFEQTPQTKPAFAAYQVAVSELETAHFQRILTVGETNASDMEAYEFNDKLKRRALFVAWLDPIDSVGTKPLRVPARLATVRDIYGASYTLSDGQDGQIDGYVTVAVGGQPVYIEVDW